MDVESASGAAVGPRVVYGYIRMEEPDETEIARLPDELARYCLGHAEALWRELGYPTWDRIGLTVRGAEHTVWVAADSRNKPSDTRRTT